MFGEILRGIVTFIFAFSLGAGFAQKQPEPKPTDSELQQKVQEHMDVIVDESAAIVDDVVEELEKNENVQKAEEFVNDVHEIANNTKEDIQDHFGREEETEAVTEGALEEETEETDA